MQTIYSYNPSEAGIRLSSSFTDNLGSILSILDRSGESVYEATYDVWGQQEVTLNEIGFHRGYTGHEMLPEFGIINMNGRLYDPMLGRFLSPDNYVQSPTNSQNFNRYSYCLNNPLKYTDPSGEFWEWVITGAIMGAIYSGAMADMNGGHFWNGAWKGAIVGGASSAAGMYVGGVVSGALGSGFISGFASGAASGAVGGFIGGVGNAWMNGTSFKNGLQTGAVSAAWGAVISGAIEGLNNGLDATRHNGNFWTGKGTAYEDVIKGKVDVSKPIVFGEGMGYSEAYTEEFKNISFGKDGRIDNSVEHLYGDGTLPSDKYIFENGYVKNTKTGDYVNGVSVQVGHCNAKSNVYLFPSAYTSKEQLYMTMGHEFLHAIYNGNGLHGKDWHHGAIYKWQMKQGAAWHMDLSKFTIYNKFHYNKLYDKYTFEILSIRPWL